MLALVVGVRESARRMGISEEAVKKRCTREGWLADPVAREIARKSVQERARMTPVASMVPKMSPSHALNLEIKGLGEKTRLGIARGIAKAAQTVEEMPGAKILEQAQNVKAVAQTASIVHGWDKQGPGFRIKLDVLQNGQEKAAIEVESEVVTDQTWDDQEPV
jgi:hypothetical protein